MNIKSALVLKVIFLVLSGSSLVGCSGSEVNPEQAYRNCMIRGMKELDRKRRQKGPSQMTTDYKEYIADEQCRPGVEACTEDPKSFSCRDFLKKYKRAK